MIAQLFEPRNVQTVPFNEMVSDRPYNEWLESPFVITNETMAVRADARYKAYEHLKDMIDPRTKKARINPKYGKQRFSTVHSTFLFFSNHEDALAISPEDRRFYVIENAPVPETPQYFFELNEWLEENDEDGRPIWARHIWWWLQAREVNIVDLLAPPDATDAKDSMMAATQSAIEIALDAALAANPTEYVVADRVKRVLESVAGRIGLYDINRWELLFRRLYTARTSSFPQDFTLWVGGKTVRPRIVSNRARKATFRVNARKQLPKGAKLAVTKLLEDYDEAAVMKAVEEALDLSDL
jgi:hypothetical protein